MMRGMSLLKMTLAIAVLALCSCSSPHGSWLAEIKGRADARKDLRAGKLRLETMGLLPAPWERTNEDLLKERYGIQYSRVAGCVVSDELIGHAKGYNQIMTAEIHRKFGDDVLHKTAD
ncbi:MAG: hypothetical protein B7Z42_14700, partial [Brevundimonas sp. 12-68-7]